MDDTFFAASVSRDSRSPGTNLRKSAQSVDKKMSADYTDFRRLRPAPRHGHHANRPSMRFGTLICVPNGCRGTKKSGGGARNFCRKAVFRARNGAVFAGAARVLSSFCNLENFAEFGIVKIENSWFNWNSRWSSVDGAKLPAHLQSANEEDRG